MFTALEASALISTDKDLEKAKDGERSAYINKDGTFKGGFKGCERYQQNVKGLSKESAAKLCAFIGRKAGKIP